MNRISLAVSSLLTVGVLSLMSACSTASNTTGSGVDARPASIDASPSTGAVCGDGVCAPSEEATCASDCGASVCNNDGICGTGETTANCPHDCPAAATCNNDGTCETGETAASCPADCGSTTGTCNNDGSCETGETSASCPADCGGSTATCNNDGQCGLTETPQSCPADCGTSTGTGDCTDQNLLTGCLTCIEGAGACPTGQTMDSCTTFLTTCLGGGL